MAEDISLVFFVLALALAALLVFAGWRAHQRRIAFDRTVAREHPELRHLQPEHDQLGLVAARAVDVRTPGAPRELGGWEST